MCKKMSNISINIFFKLMLINNMKIIKIYVAKKNKKAYNLIENNRQSK